MTVAIVNYIQFKSFKGVDLEGYSFQNFFINQTKTLDNKNYVYAPFAIAGGAGTKGGDRSDSTLVAPAYPLATNLFIEACREKWLCEMSMYLLDPITYDEIQRITVETWMASKVELTPERVVLRLSSPFDAVDAQVPKRMLSTALVGSLPTTGSVSVR